jgi:hypothetical protein
MKRNNDEPYEAPPILLFGGIDFLGFVPHAMIKRFGRALYDSIEATVGGMDTSIERAREAFHGVISQAAEKADSYRVLSHHRGEYRLAIDNAVRRAIAETFSQSDRLIEELGQPCAEITGE